jgi:beta-N-acetylhexosaminidase
MVSRMAQAATDRFAPSGAACIARCRRRVARLRLALLLAGAALGLSGSATALPAPSLSAVLKLSDAQLAGQRVVYSYSGLNPPARLLAQIRAGQAAGVIFFADNIASLSQIRGVARQLQRAAAQSKIKTPLLLMTDQEGGLVRRLPGAPFMSEKQLGQAHNPDGAVLGAGRAAGHNLSGAGLNVNLAPVLDVYRSPGNFIDQFGRSYSNRASLAARLGADFIGAQQGVKVAATAKHFPGLGAATSSQNTDEVPVTLNLSLHSLRSVDELPYQSAIKARAALVMVSWATYPALDRHRPAGLSGAVVGSELRKRLGFAGVTITDALEAGALSAFGSTASRATLAAGAGMDLILCSSRNAGQGIAAEQALAAQLHSGKLNRKTFTAAVDRVLALRQALGH